MNPTNQPIEDRVVLAVMSYWRNQHGGDYDHHGAHIHDHARYIRQIVRKALGPAIEAGPEEVAR